MFWIKLQDCNTIIDQGMTKIKIRYQIQGPELKMRIKDQLLDDQHDIRDDDQSIGSRIRMVLGDLLSLLGRIHCLAECIPQKRTVHSA